MESQALASANIGGLPFVGIWQQLAVLPCWRTHESFSLRRTSLRAIHLAWTFSQIRCRADCCEILSMDRTVLRDENSATDWQVRLQIIGVPPLVRGSVPAPGWEDVQ